MLLQLSYLNEQGRRKNIEDSLYPLPGKAKKSDPLFLVCDGVGGESKGEEASRIVCETIGGLLQNQPQLTVDSIRNAVGASIIKMQQYAAIHPEAENMSTTLTLAAIQPDGVWVAWCGDSRVYHIRAGKVLWHTRDHSLVQQLVDSGEITEQEALRHPRKNIILRSLNGKAAKTDIETHFINDIQAGDYILLCTDGLLENIGEKELYTILNDSRKEENKSQLFLNECLDKTNDNFSMYLLQLSGDPRPAAAKIKSGNTWLWAILSIIVAAGIFFWWQSNKKPAQETAVPVVKPSDTIIQNNSSNVPLPKIPVPEKNTSLPATKKNNSAGP